MQILKKQAEEDDYLKQQYHYLSKLVSGELFEVQEKLNKRIEKDVDYYFNDCINCGGYALKIDTCIFPGEEDFEKRVSGILESFPFVRLLGDTKLQDDEYLVLYRSAGNKGHHFVRIEDDGTVVEKWENKAPQNFKDWKDAENSPEAVFAVKKEHEMEYFEEKGSIYIPTPTSKNFEETVWQAMQNRQNTFEYHNHSYTLKKDNEETIYICSNNEIIAEMITDGENYEIEIKPEKEAYVSNTESKTPIVIKDGKCQGNSKEERMI